MLSGQVALLVVIASVVAFFIGWLLKGGRPVPIPASAAVDTGPTLVSETLTASDELIRARALSEELGRNLAATETQCMEALEQRDEAERLASQRAVEARKLREDLDELKAKETVPLEAHLDMVQRFQSLQERAQSSAGRLDELERQLGETKATLESRERERAEARQEAKDVRRQMQALHGTHEGVTREINGFKQQLADAADLASRKQGLLEQLAKDKAEAEISLKARIAELEAKAVVAVPEPPSVRPIQLPKPPLPPAEVLSAPVDDTFGRFPLAPEAVGRKPLGESLFDDASLTSFSPEVPSLDDARGTLAGLEQELQEKDQLIEALTAEQAQRQQALESLRQSLPEEQDKLHGAEREEHAVTARLATASKERDRSRRQVRALTRSLALAAEHTDHADDLTRIKGIKGGISQQLHAFGIFTYSQIVEWDAEDMLAFSELLAFKNRLHRDRWQDQAKALMEVKYGSEPK